MLLLAISEYHLRKVLVPETPHQTEMVKRCFIFKPDGIGDFFLASGVIRLLSREFGEENLVIAVLPEMQSVVRGQFPGSSVITLPIRKKRVVLNLFAANCLRCFAPWLKLLGARCNLAISLRHMRDYLQGFLFCSVPAERRLVASNLLLGNGRPIRRWTENMMRALFSLEVLDYPDSVSVCGIPSELEANRLLLSAALRRDVDIREIWPELKAAKPPSISCPYAVCAPFSSDIWKDFPESRWSEFFGTLHRDGALPLLVLTGSPGQRTRLEFFSEMIRRSSGKDKIQVSVMIAEDLQGFIDLLAGAEYVFTVDTAAAHASSALDRRTMVLFSGQHQGMFAPWSRSEKQQWILPKDPIKGMAWHEAHSTEELLTVFKKIRSAP